MRKIYDMPEREMMVDDDGIVWERMPDLNEDNADYLSLGVAPRPRTARQWFRYHVLHGLLMNYPIRDVLLFAIADFILSRVARGDQWHSYKE